MRRLFLFLPAAVLAACGQDQPVAAPDAAPAVALEAPAQTAPAEPPAPAEPVQYWGVKPGDALPIIWQDLIPLEAEEELVRQQSEFYAALEKRYASGLDIAEGSEADTMPQLGTFDVSEELDGQLIRIPGYVVPLDGSQKGRFTEFLFVPYMGACIHTPPPPPNQILLVQAPEGVKVDDIWTAYYLEGTLSIGKFLNDTGNAAYAVDFRSLKVIPVPEP
jgi:hypothetical protein